MQYAENLEASGKALPELLTLSSMDLSTQFSMKTGHVVRFTDRTKCDNDSFQLRAIMARRRSSIAYRHNSSIPKSSTLAASNNSSKKMDSVAELQIKDGYVFKGIVAAEPAEPRACGCVQPPPV